MTDDANSFITKGLCWASYLSFYLSSYFPNLGCEKPQRANPMAPSLKPLPSRELTLWCLVSSEMQTILLKTRKEKSLQFMTSRG